MTDSHSPGEYRVNGVLRNIPEFYRAYNVQPGDKMYLASKPHIGTAAIFFRGGQDFKLPADGDPELQCVDDTWPDAMLLLGAGRVVLKQYAVEEDRYMGGTGWLEIYDAGENSLLVFTAALLALVTERSSVIESPIDLARYTRGLAATEPTQCVHFPLTRPAPQRVPLWAASQDGQASGG